MADPQPIKHLKQMKPRITQFWVMQFYAFPASSVPRHTGLLHVRLEEWSYSPQKTPFHSSVEVSSSWEWSALDIDSCQERDCTESDGSVSRLLQWVHGSAR
jgi:hypothetical protein